MILDIEIKKPTFTSAKKGTGTLFRVFMSDANETELVVYDFLLLWARPTSTNKQE